MKTRAAIAVAFLAALGAARAQLPDCPSINRDPAAYKVVLGDVVVPPSATPDVLTARDSALFMLRTGEETLRVLRDPQERRQLRTAVCDGRRPEDQTVFNPNVVDSLSQLGVILEVWGQVRRVPGAAARSDAKMNFAVISLLRFEPALEGFLQTPLALPAAGAAGEGADPVELQALAALSLALRYQRDGRYDASARNYCVAVNKLDGAVRRAAAADAPAWTALRDFSTKGRLAVVKEARADNAYKGNLRLLPADQLGCPG